MKLLFIIMMVMLNLAYADDVKPCVYLHENELEPSRIEKCINLSTQAKNKSDSEVIIDKNVAATASYNEDNLSKLYSEYGLFYFTKSSKIRKVINYDNGPDYFQEGLARTSKEGKIGFFDKKLNIVIPPSFDFAFPFKNGYALVCNGCRKEADGEYEKLVDGFWGGINRSGDVVVPIKHTQSEAVEALNHVRQ